MEGIELVDISVNLRGISTWGIFYNLSHSLVFSYQANFYFPTKLCGGIMDKKS